MMLEGKYHRGFRFPENETFQVRIGDSIAGKTAVERHTQVIADINNDHGISLPAVPFEKESFISHYSTPLISQGRILGVLEMYHREQKALGKELLSYFETIGGQTAVAIDKIRQITDLNQANLQSKLAFDRAIETLPYLLELRKVDIPGHSQRVADLTLQMAILLGYKDRELEYIRYGAILHDVGLLTIPDQILLKPGKLDPDEWEQVKQHPNTAFNILSKNLALEKALVIPRYHHEKWDGSGYPFGLSAEQIPEPARIFAVADVWDILRSDRPYRKKWEDEKALAYIKEQAGAHFDPRSVDAFLDILSIK
jgi:HD-GYP domain-containing protein (c-di-GMP phosphodiesterase class II)